MRESRAWLGILVLILTGICLLGLFSTEVADTDFWWHLKTGQYIFQRHALPVPDPFAYTTVQDPVAHFNLTHEWLAQAMLYGVYAMAGIPGVILARAVLLTLICGLAGLLAARRSGNYYAGIAGAFAAASLAVEFASDRPALVTFLFVALFMVILEFRRALWLLPPFALLWANCHGGFFLGWIVLLAYCAERKPPDRKRLWLIAACAIAISAVNPNGFGVLWTLLRYRQSAMTATLVEWHSPYLWGPPYAFDLLLYAAALVLMISRRKVRVVDWILFGAFALASLTAFRNILLIGVLAPMLIATYFPWRSRIPRAAVWAVPPLLIAVLSTGLARGSFFQLRAATWKFPAGAADYLLANHISGPMFNTYEYGGYLIWRLWPQQRVFIDGRALSESVYKDYRQILYNLGSAVDQVAGPRAELLNRYGVQVIVMNTFEYLTGAAYPLALALANPASSEWQLVYDDPQSLIFLRNPPAGTQVYPDRTRQVLDHMEAECAAYIENSPETPQCARTLADYWMRAGDRNRARRMLVLYLSHVTEKDPPAERALQNLSRP